MRALIDAHVFLWWVLDHPELSDACRDVLVEGSNEVFLSVATAYEIAYKAGQGRLTLPEPPETYVPSRVAANGFTSLPLSQAHALRAAALPLIHRDPFDRLLIAQSQLEDLPILTADAAIARYDVEVIW